MPSAQTSAERSGRLSPGEARERIRKWLPSTCPDFNMAALAELRETDFGIPELYERTSTQYFTLFNDVFILHGNTVERIFPMASHEGVLADADGCGSPEAVFAGDAGSGLYIPVVTVVKEGKAYRKTVERTASAARYRLEKRGDGAALLVRMNCAGSDSSNEEPIGAVRLDNGQITFVK